MKFSRLSPARISRSLVTILALTFIQTVSSPILNFQLPQAAAAVTQGSSTTGTTYGGGGGGANTPADCSGGAITGIGASSTLSSSLYITAFSYTCTAFNANATLSSTTNTVTPLGTPDSLDSCQAGQVAIGINVRESNNGNKYIAGIGLRCGNPMSQGSIDSRAIKPGVAATGGTDSSYTCSAGTVLVGFALRTGGGVDQLAPKCAAFTTFTYAAVGTPSIASSGPHTASIAFTGVTTNIADTSLTYTVTAVPTSGTTITATGSSSPISLTGLGSNMAYTITVTGSNSYGTSAATGSVALSSALLPGSDTDTALTLNGTNQYADLTDVANSPFDSTGSITMEAWINPASTCSGDQAIISKLYSYMMYCGGGFLKYVYSANGTSWSGSASTVPIIQGQWHHIAYAKDAASTNVYIYVDGYLVSTVNGGPTSMSANDQPFSVGSYNSGNYFQGQIDEVKIFNSLRTQNQIQSDMNTYGSLTDTNLKAYFDFNEGTGTKVYNRIPGSTSSSDLTLYNSPTWTDIKSVDTNSLSTYTTVQFPRTYLTQNGGWKVPTGISRLSYLVVAGGGAGGGGYTSTNDFIGGGGGGGGVRMGVLTSPTGYFTPVVGPGQYYLSCQQDRGRNSSLAGTAITTITATGGGSGGCWNGSGWIDGYSGGSGGGAGSQVSKSLVGSGNAGSYSPVEGYDGGTGQTDGSYSYNQASGGGGGAAGAGGAAGIATGGTGGAGIFANYSGSLKGYGSGGGGGTRGSASAAGGTASDGGGAGGLNTAQGSKGVYLQGGGGGGTSAQKGNSGGTGVVFVRWINALVPAYTKPSNAYLNIGMTETFTTNVAQDSATAILTRNFKWESTTPTANGVYTLIKQGTGAANAAFSWIPTDTSTSGSGYLYRLTVTDSDTAGLFITDSSTAFAIINRALSVVGTSTITKRINLARNETFTITLGTSTYRPSLSPVIPGITLDTSTAGLAVIKIADTVTVGTYYETLTVIDSVSASVVTPMIIKVAAPPTLLNSGEIVSDGLVLNLDAGNSASLIADSGTVTTAFTWNDLSGSKANAATGAGVNTGGLYGTTCTAPKYTSENGGALTFTANSTNCYYASGFTGNNLINNYSIEAWFRTSATLPSGAGIVGQSVPNTSARSSIYIANYSTSGLIVAFFDNVAGLERYANCPYVPTIGAWTHIAGTYDGTTMTTYINGASRCTATFSWTPNSSINTLGTIIGKGPAGGSDTAFPGSIATVRMYNKALTSAQILANFNATKNRFDNSNIAFLTPSKQYGATLLDSFTATSGLDTKTVTFSVGDRAGIDWDTTTVTNRINLTLQESLTVGTYLDTVTVTDSLGQSTYLPLVMTTTKADTLTVTIGTATTVTYNGSAITIYPRATVTGLKWTDTATSLTRFASTLYTETTTVPVNADTYTVRGALPVFTVGSIDNYLGVIYDTSTAVVNKAFQRPLNIFMYGGVVGSPYYIYLQGGSGTGVVTETLTGVATLTGCAINNHFLTAAEQKQGFCEVRVVKAGDQNYFSETQTVQLYFMAFIRNNPTNQSGSGSTIALNGQTSLTIDDSSTVRVPRITGFSKNGSTLTINGQGFGSSPVTVTFERYVDAAVAPTPTGGGTVITVTIPGSAISGPVLVITSGGRDSIDWLDLP